MRSYLVAFLAMAVFASHGTAISPAAASDVMEARVGELLMLKLPGNQAAGYKWRLNKDMSENLELVIVDPVGWQISPKSQRSSFFFQSDPATMNYSVLPKRAGEADLAFDYYRNWGNRAQMKTKKIRVVIKPAAR